MADLRPRSGNREMASNSEGSLCLLLLLLVIPCVFSRGRRGAVVHRKSRRAWVRKEQFWQLSSSAILHTMMPLCHALQNSLAWWECLSENRSDAHSCGLCSPGRFADGYTESTKLHCSDLSALGSCFWLRRTRMATAQSAAPVPWLERSHLVAVLQRSLFTTAEPPQATHAKLQKPLSTGWALFS